jgi:hypothetical protein
MRKLVFLTFLLVYSLSQAQVITPKKGYEDMNIGITYEDVIWILGFDGSKVIRDSAPEMLKAPADQLGVDYDYIVNFRYIMDYPVTSIYFKGNLAVLFTFSSYPEYNQFICQDVQTSTGLKFWDKLDRVRTLYGKNPDKLDFGEGNQAYYAYKNAGICFGMDNDQVRTILIFDPDFK